MTYFPSREAPDAWERRDPDTVGMDPDALDDAIEYAVEHESDIPQDFAGHEELLGAVLGPLPDRRGDPNGLVIKDGYVVAEWGDPGAVDLAFSVTKSFLSTAAGVAYDEGCIEDVDDEVATYVDEGGFESEHNRKITWRQFLNGTSEWRGELWGKPDTDDRREGENRELREPGTFWEYNDVRVNRLALAVLRVLEEPLPEVVRREVMDPIGASDSWTWHGYENSYVDIDGERMQSVSGGGHWGGGLWIHSWDLARWAYLYLRGGEWDGEQLLSEEWLSLATTPCDVKPEYGFLLWLNTDRRLWLDAPEESFAALGHGFNVAWIDPGDDLVVVARWYGGVQDLLPNEEKRRRQNELIGRFTNAVK